MPLFRKFFIVFQLATLVGVTFPASAGNAGFEQRRTDYVSSALANVNSDAVTVQAYAGVPVDSATLQAMLAILPTSDVVDFTIVKLVRILYFTNGQYDSLIVPELNKLPFWLRKDEALRVYWSENHMILWMSSDWLLHERYGRPVDASLDNRLRHYLRLKVQYGFYEFFSSVYLPYSLSALLNLADFSQDAEIKSLASQAAQRLLKDILLLTNDKGVFFPAAGRNYYGKYETPYGQNHSHLIYLLTGMGAQPTNASAAGGFLASTTLDVDSVIGSWSPYADTLYTIGHSLDSSFVINAGQAPLDKVMFQWSAGAYFHPDVALETAYLLQDSTLWNHHEFAGFTEYMSINISQAQFLANLASPISKSSLIMGQDVAIFKHQSVTLSSIQDFWKGKLGYQQMPCVANVGTTAVMTAAGKSARDWSNGSSHNANEHLPSVHQKSNVALLMYRPEKEGLSIFKHDSLAVALRWINTDFEEVVINGLWLLGRQDAGYIAVRRSCTDVVGGVYACDKPEGQTWVMVVGDSAMYGSFANFQSVINQSQFEERRYFNAQTSQSVYYAKIVVDTIAIEYAWGNDTSFVSGDHTTINTGRASSFGMFPNPAQDHVTLSFGALNNEPLTVKVFNALGVEIFHQQMQGASLYTVNTARWNQGMYLVTVESSSSLFTQKLLKTE